MVQLPRHCMNGASRGEHEGIVKVQDASAVAEQERAGLLLLWCGRTIVQNQLRMAPGGKSRRGGIVRVNLDGTVQQVKSLHRGVGIACKYEGKCAHGKLVSIKVPRPFASRALDFGPMNVRQDRSHDAFRDQILQPQQIIGLAVVGVPPNMKIRRRVK